jgi:hypothetical protein
MHWPNNVTFLVIDQILEPQYSKLNDGDGFLFSRVLASLDDYDLDSGLAQSRNLCRIGL